MDARFTKDYERYKKQKWTASSYRHLLSNGLLRYIYYGRMSTYPGAVGRMFGFFQKVKGKKMGNEIGWLKIDEGLVLDHPYAITVNPGAIIGKDCTLFKGATIGSVRSGKTQGVPKIGDRVTICCNAMVCGGITVGNDVLIAAGAYVNFDVPENSVVIGNPGVIHHKENPSADYL